MTSQPQVNTTVIIVGAGVAGLTLALSLEQANIPFVVLEAHQEVAPQVGASLGLLPNGLLILDQLGVYEDIRSVTTPCCRSFHRSASGNVLLDSNAFGYFDDE
jgi:2-polyprenyl-6-methoxyphenol hydroxylase-like FAD-dependent oxidoreductase